MTSVLKGIDRQLYGNCYPAINMMNGEVRLRDPFLFSSSITRSNYNNEKIILLGLCDEKKK